MRKLVSFTEAEWEVVEGRMSLVGVGKFDQFARRVVLDGEVRVRRVGFDPKPLGAELARIGNNINQIARLVNTEGVTTFAEMRATRELVREIQGVIERAVREAE